jgi:ABC-type amino acid transport system permease subunit
MAQQPLSDDGGTSPRISLRLPDDTLTNVVLAAAAESVTISEWCRGAIEAELMRRQIELAEAAGMAVLPVPDRGKAPPG